MQLLQVGFLCYLLLPFAQGLQLQNVQAFLTGFSVERNVISTAVFSLMTIYIVSRGIRAGIERWSQRLMPLLLVLLLVLFAYIVVQPGASEGLARYLISDMSKALEPITPDCRSWTSISR